MVITMKWKIVIYVQNFENTPVAMKEKDVSHKLIIERGSAKW